VSTKYPGASSEVVSKRSPHDRRTRSRLENMLYMSAKSTNRLVGYSLTARSTSAPTSTWLRCRTNRVNLVHRCCPRGQEYTRAIIGVYSQSRVRLLAVNFFSPLINLAIKLYLSKFATISVSKRRIGPDRRAWAISRSSVSAIYSMRVLVDPKPAWLHSD